MNEELEVLITAAQRLEEANISYLISGSTAANYYTIPRMTRDIDIVIELAMQDINSFLKAFEKDFWVDADMIKEEVRKRGMFNLIHKSYLIKIDFILRKLNAFGLSMFQRKKKIQINQQNIWLASPEDLILAKCLWAKDSFSELQINDIRNLLTTVNGLDYPYMEHWVANLDLEKIYQKAKA